MSNIPETRAAHRIALIKVFYDVPGTTQIPPVGILFVGGELRKAGYDVRVFHLPHVDARDKLNDIIDWKPDMIGFSLITGDPLDVVVDMTARLDEALPSATIIYGGVHPTLAPAQCLETTGLDYVVMHEGERTAVRLADCVLREQGDPTAIPGLAFMKSGAVVINEFEGFEHNLDDYDADWSLVDIERYVNPEYAGVRRVLMGYVASRGCPHQCGFCYNLIFNKRRWRHPSVEKVVRDVNALAAKYDLGGVVFHDDNFTANSKWALGVIEGLKLAALHIETRIDYVKESFLQDLVDRKVTSIFFGVESGSNRILDLMKKGFHVEDTRRALSLVNKYPLTMKLSIILGAPTETLQDYRATLELIIWCIENIPGASFTIGFYLPFPGTPLFDLCVERGFEAPSDMAGWVVMDRWGNQDMRIPWTEGQYLTSTETGNIRRWSGDLKTLWASNWVADRLRYRLLRWRFLNSGSPLLLRTQGLRKWAHWRLSRSGRQAVLDRVQRTAHSGVRACRRLLGAPGRGKLTVAFNMRPAGGPWGGGSAFVDQMGAFLIRKGVRVTYDLADRPDIVFLMDPRDELQNVEFSVDAIRRYRELYPATRVIHRINECDKRKTSNYVDEILHCGNAVADMTVFISRWLADYFTARWFDVSRPHAVIYNGADPAVFNPAGALVYPGHGPVRLVTHHWSDGRKKGFDVYKQVDRMIADGTLSNTELWIVGRWPQDIKWEAARTFPPESGKPLADILRQCHLYLTASLWEPCGMHHVEGTQCGLPVVYHEDGGGIVEACKRYGVGFRDDPAAAIRQAVAEYTTLRARALEHMPSGSKMCEDYWKLIQMLASR